MAAQRCTGCKKFVSSRAKTCPACGKPTGSGGIAARPDEIPAAATEKSAAKSKAQSDRQTGALITIILLVSCGGCIKCINSGPKTDWDNDKVHQQRMLEKSAVEDCIREGRTRAWCEDRMDVLKRTGR